MSKAWDYDDNDDDDDEDVDDHNDDEYDDIILLDRLPEAVLRSGRSQYRIL